MATNANINQGTVVLTDFPFFAQTPVKLIRDSKISRNARVLFGVYHSYARSKDLRNGRPLTFVSQKRLSKDLGCCEQSISNWTHELNQAGWITIRRRGWKSNFIFLHAKPKRRKK